MWNHHHMREDAQHSQELTFTVFCHNFLLTGVIASVIYVNDRSFTAFFEIKPLLYIMICIYVTTAIFFYCFREGCGNCNLLVRCLGFILLCIASSYLMAFLIVSQLSQEFPGDGQNLGDAYYLFNLVITMSAMALSLGVWAKIKNEMIEVEDGVWIVFLLALILSIIFYFSGYKRSGWGCPLTLGVIGIIYGFYLIRNIRFKTEEKDIGRLVGAVYIHYEFISIVCCFCKCGGGDGGGGGGGGGQQPDNYILVRV